MHVNSLETIENMPTLASMIGEQPPPQNVHDIIMLIIQTKNYIVNYNTLLKQRKASSITVEEFNRFVYNINSKMSSISDVLQKITQEGLSKKLPGAKEGICPYCGSNETQYTDIFHYDDVGVNEMVKKCFCEKCGKHYSEVYRGTYLYTEKE